MQWPSSDSNTFSVFCMYHFSALLNPHFSHSFQWSISTILWCFTCLYSFCASFEKFETICATVSSPTTDTRRMDWTFFPLAWSCAATILLSVSFFKYPFFNWSHDLLLLLPLQLFETVHKEIFLHTFLDVLDVILI